MKLLTTHVNPDVVGAEVNIRVASKTQAINIEQGRQALVGDGDIDVLHGKYVADVVGGPVIGLSGHLLSPSRGDLVLVHRMGPFIAVCQKYSYELMEHGGGEKIFFHWRLIDAKEDSESGGGNSLALVKAVT